MSGTIKQGDGEWEMANGPSQEARQTVDAGIARTFPETVPGTVAVAATSDAGGASVVFPHA